MTMGTTPRATISQDEGLVGETAVLLQESMDLYFGVDNDHDCRIDQWRRSYQASAMLNLHQVKVDLELMTASSGQLRSGGGDLWLWRQSGEFVIHPVSFIWRLPNVCS